MPWSSARARTHTQTTHAHAMVARRGPDVSSLSSGLREGGRRLRLTRAKSSASAYRKAHSSGMPVFSGYQITGLLLTTEWVPRFTDVSAAEHGRATITLCGLGLDPGRTSMVFQAHHGTVRNSKPRSGSGAGPRKFSIPGVEGRFGEWREPAASGSRGPLACA